MENTAERVKRVIHEQVGYINGITADCMKPEMSFVDDLGADSLDEIEIVMALEDEFEMEIGDDDASKIKTVQQAIDYIASKVPAIAGGGDVKLASASGGVLQ